MFEPVFAPNPVHDVMYIHLPKSETQFRELRIYDTNGQIKKELTVKGQSTRIDNIVDLLPGVYFLTYELNSGETQIHSFVKI